MKTRLLAGVAVAAAALTAAAPAATLYQSLPDLTVNPVQNAYCSSCGGEYRVFDGFSLGSASVLNSVTFAVQSNYNYPTATTVSFNTRLGGTPGAEIASYTFDPAAFTSNSNTSYDTALITVARPCPRRGRLRRELL